MKKWNKVGRSSYPLPACMATQREWHAYQDFRSFSDTGKLSFIHIHAFSWTVIGWMFCFILQWTKQKSLTLLCKTTKTPVSDLPPCLNRCQKSSNTHLKCWLHLADEMAKIVDAVWNLCVFTASTFKIIRACFHMNLVDPQISANVRHSFICKVIGITNSVKLFV